MKSSAAMKKIKTKSTMPHYKKTAPKVLKAPKRSLVCAPLARRATRPVANTPSAKLPLLTSALRPFSTTDPFAQQSAAPGSLGADSGAAQRGKFPFQPKKFSPAPLSQFTPKFPQQHHQHQQHQQQQKKKQFDELDGNSDESANSDLESATSGLSECDDPYDPNKASEDMGTEVDSDFTPLSGHMVDSRTPADFEQTIAGLTPNELKYLSGTPLNLRPHYRDRGEKSESDTPNSDDVPTADEFSDRDGGGGGAGVGASASRGRSGGNGGDDNNGRQIDPLDLTESEVPQTLQDQREYILYKDHTGKATHWKKQSSRDIELSHERPFISDLEGPLLFSDDPDYKEVEPPVEEYLNQFDDAGIGEINSSDFETLGTLADIRDPEKEDEVRAMFARDKNMRLIPGPTAIRLPRLKPGRKVPKGWMITESGHCVPEVSEHVHHKYADPDLYTTPAQERLRQVVQSKLPNAFKMTPSEQESFMEVTQTGHHGAYTRRRQRVLKNPLIDNVVAKINARRGSASLNDFEENVDLSIQLQNVSPYARKFHHDFTAQGHAFLDIPKSTVNLIRQRKRAAHRLPGPSMDYSFQNTAYHKATH